MGLTLPVLRLIARAHNDKPIAGPVLTLGRQAIYATFEEVCAAWRVEGVSPRQLPAGCTTTTNIPAFKDGPQAGFTSDRAVFLSLAGVEPVALDESAYEGADHIVDLNRPVPTELEGRFDLIVDAGTLEHVFDVKQAFSNTARMLRVGGRIVHASPANNWLQHGFYQFSPTFFYDFYGANGYSNFQCYLLEATKKYMGKGYSGACNYWEWNPQRQYCSMFSEHALSVVFIAEKTISTRSDVIPQQGEFLKVGMGGRMGGVDTIAAGTSSLGTDRLRFLKRMLPEWFKEPLRRLKRRWSRQDVSLKPWGLRYLGQI